MTNKEKVLGLLSNKNGIQLVQFSQDFSSFFQLTEENNEISEANKELLDLIGSLNTKEIIEIRNHIMKENNIALNEISAIKSVDSSNSKESSGEAVVFKAVLKGIPDANKTSAIKLVKELLGLTIVESKNTVEKVMGGDEFILKEGLTQAQVNEIIEKFKQNSITVIAKSA